MKTILRCSFIVLILLVSLPKLKSQCTVSDIVIQNVTAVGTQTPTTCTVSFDLSFTIENNNGNKFIFIHAWLQDDYPNYFQCVNGQSTINGSVRAPNQTVLADAFVNIGIDNEDSIPEIITTYPPDPGVPMTTVASIEREVTADGSAIFILKGVTVTLPILCGTPVVVIADLWSSQSARAQVAHCVNCGISYSAGYLSLAGFANCTNLTFTGTLTNNTGTVIDGYYRVYADVNGDAYFTPAIDTLIVDSTDFTVNANSSTSISGPIPADNINQDLFVLLTQTSGAASGASRVILLPAAPCAPLPVTFRSFTANRLNRSSVNLRWETLTELNNNGFAVQRNLGNNNWHSVSFIRSQARDGNSSSPLVYTFSDLNTHKGISQYRIKQVDLDGKSKFSEVRAVRGEGQHSQTIVYPVPSRDGRVTVVFDEIDGTRDVSLMDMNGRALRQWKGVTNNTLLIENLGDGVFTIRIQNTVTGSVSNAKIIVSRN